MQSQRRVVAILLTSLLPLSCSAVFSATRVSSPSNSRAVSSRGSGSRISEHGRAFHALQRLTFGPRPGEVDEVAAMGVNRWIELQLHPKKIDDSALEQRLAEYRAPFLTPQTLMLDFPSGNLIRQAVRGRIAVPHVEPARAVWEGQMARMRQRQQLQVQQQMQSARRNEMGSENTAPEPTMQSGTVASMEAPSADAARLVDLPAQERYKKLLQMQPGHMQQFVRSLRPAERPALVAGMTPTQRETVIALLNPRLVVVNEAEDVRLLQDIYSERQLQRVMTEFWLNHFNIFTNKNQVEPYYLPQFAQQAIAPHALGKFEDLLEAVAHSPAMLIYLDNQQSVGPHSLFAVRRAYREMYRFRLAQRMGPQQAGAEQVPASTRFQNQPYPGINENYGRELMELHTVGVNGGYTQQDVIEAAKVLTGWTVAPPKQGGGFRFDENRHEPGTKIVMGHRIQEGGEREGQELLHILATSPATAHFVSRELAVRFVSDTPSKSLVDRMARTFLSSHGNIGMVLKTMIHSPEFWAASNRGNKIKTPLDYVVSAVRATNADVSQPYRLVSEIRVMGMPLTGTQEPNGYSMMNEAWASTSELVNRMNFALALASNRIPGVAVTLDSLLAQDSSGWTPEQQEAGLENAILNGPASSRIHQAVLASLNDTDAQNRATARLVLAGDGGGNPFEAGLKRRIGPSTNVQEAVMAGLLIGSPEFQRR